ncbi:ribonuclease activity regulator RraA [Bosea caraganae]|uniref:Ribonuclease activity regulator RraA n=1 Tax=Bosea caraganae TaxID=2763117 RepID=A0A370L8B3_9HYPH|nr:ribonuclease activity regulator RraA [Bosea caraganae]RDJ25175.1 ribonuclease activity regulator RraA [Bosea caraganae]RDJ26285.1 ribonuclease activity regulator RraA [Bosea caraganae]
MTACSPETIALLKQVPTAAITGLLLKKYGLRMRAIPGLVPIDGAKCRFVGPAFTLRYVPMREDIALAVDIGNPANAMLQATQQIPAGSVFVMDMCGNGAVGGLGDVLVTRMLVRGVVGVVSDGGMRDVAEIRSLGMPTYCKGPAAPASPSALIPIAIQEPIGCGGVLIYPGDIIVADEDGVAVIPVHLAAEVATQAIEKEALDGWVRERVAEGGDILGLYPPNEANLAKFKAWKAAQG